MDRDAGAEANALTIRLGDEKIGTMVQAKDGWWDWCPCDAEGALDLTLTGTARSRAAAVMAVVEVWLARQQKEQSA